MNLRKEREKLKLYYNIKYINIIVFNNYINFLENTK
jgi:hypothetical protein